MKSFIILLTTVSSNSMGSKILIPACTFLNSFHKVLTVEHTSLDHSTQVFINVTMEYVKSSKGGFKLLYDNYMYMKQKVLKTTSLPEVILVTIALSVSYALEKPWKFLKNETQKFYSGRGFVRGVLSGVFVLEPAEMIKIVRNWCIKSTMQAYFPKNSFLGSFTGSSVEPRPSLGRKVQREMAENSWYNLCSSHTKMHYERRFLTVSGSVKYRIFTASMGSAPSPTRALPQTPWEGG